MRHLTEKERRDFAVELVDALSDAAELGVNNAARSVVTSWHATARIKADPEQYRDALRPLEGDPGPVEIIL